jgi:hypothetical protein
VSHQRFPSVAGGWLAWRADEILCRMIGVEPHKGSHTAVAIGMAEEPLGELRVRASAAQAQRLLAWAAAWPERTWAIEGAAGCPGPRAGFCRSGGRLDCDQPNHQHLLAVMSLVRGCLVIGFLRVPWACSAGNRRSWELSAGTLEWWMAVRAFGGFPGRAGRGLLSAGRS